MSETVAATYRYWPELFGFVWPRRFSFTVSGPDGDHLIRAIRAGHSFYERDLLDALAIYMRGGAGIVIDVGANIGNHSLFFTRVLGRECICVEPQEAAVSYLTTNLGSNGARSYAIRKIGLSDTPGHATITTRDGNLGASKLTSDGIGETVEVLTLDGMSRDLPKIDLIKIDAEGMESKIIRGAIETIKRHRPIVTAEAHTAEDLAEISKLFRGLRYRRHGPFCWTPTYIFVPSEKAKTGAYIWDLIRHPKRVIRGDRYAAI